MKGPSRTVVTGHHSLTALMDCRTPRLGGDNLCKRCRRLGRVVKRCQRDVRDTPRQYKSLLLGVKGRKGDYKFLRKSSKRGYSRGSLSLLRRELCRCRGDLVASNLRRVGRTRLGKLMRKLSNNCIPIKATKSIMGGPSVLPSKQGLIRFSPELIPAEATYRQKVGTTRLSIRTCRRGAKACPSAATLVL